jgi:hypothetical protein
MARVQEAALSAKSPCAIMQQARLRHLVEIGGCVFAREKWEKWGRFTEAIRNQGLIE